MNKLVLTNEEAPHKVNLQTGPGQGGPGEAGRKELSESKWGPWIRHREAAKEKLPMVLNRP